MSGWGRVRGARGCDEVGWLWLARGWRVGVRPLWLIVGGAGLARVCATTLIDCGWRGGGAGVRDHFD